MVYRLGLDLPYSISSSTPPLNNGGNGRYEIFITFVKLIKHKT